MEITSLSDEQLVESFKRTKENMYFAELFSRYQQPIYLQSFKFLRDTLSAKELTQEIFIKAYQRIEEYREGNFSGWLYRIAQNLCIDTLRGMKRAVNEWSSPDGAPLKGGVRIDGQTYHAGELNILCQQVLKIIEGLREEQKTCFLLKYVQGYNYEEIAQLTGYSIKEIKTYLQNAKRNFTLTWDKVRKGTPL